MNDGSLIDLILQAQKMSNEEARGKRFHVNFFRVVYQSSLLG